MDADRSELSALASSLEDITTRITALADRYRDTTRADVADGLDEVERALASASRQLDRALRAMR
ncbi:MAG TPA: hypothetical protein VKA65_09770 [Acidimicrobiales bacterium]|jgi:hypothetical protein|nr:hypothetical protein [Acidimicrobiales bacterium]